jgi:single-strand selective monofunctional uracil DNA glycosylase
MPAQPPIVRIARRLGRGVEGLGFGPPVTHVYHPLAYAWEPHRRYLERHARPGIEALLVGMNPGPFGMAQTGVPFGEVALVREFLRIEGAVGRPAEEHPRRPVEGFACRRSEVSGRRLWGWVRDRFGDPGPFFDRFFVWNWCPAAFLAASGANVTPDKLSAAERAPLEALCDGALADVVDHLRPRLVIGIGGFAMGRARIALGSRPVRIGSMLHPSPASPAANRGWAAAAERDLAALGIRLPAESPSGAGGSVK